MRAIPAARVASRRSIPTAPVAAGSLIVAYAVAVASGSRPLGGVVLAIGGLWCIRAWTQRHGRRKAATLAAAGLAGFAISHVLALAIGAWPSVLTVAAAVGAIAWLRADSQATARVGSRAA